jgi:hypothetical protein
MAVPFKNEFNVCRERFKTGGRLEGEAQDCDIDLIPAPKTERIREHL